MSTSAAASFSTAPSSTPRRAASRATPGVCIGRRRHDRDRRHRHRRDQGRDHPRAGGRTSRCRRSASRLTLAIDWERRHRLMRMHTACHLLTVVCPYPDHRRGGRRGRQSRVDFDIPDAGFTKEDVDGAADGTGRGRPSGLHALDHRRGTRRQSRPGEVEERAAADRHRPHPAGLHRRGGVGSTASPAAARMCSRPARSARSTSARSRRRAARTAASASASARCPR